MELSLLRLSLPGAKVPWYGTFAPWNFRSLELSLPGAKVLGTIAPRNFRSRERKFQELSLQGTFAPWNFRSRERKFLGASESSCYRILGPILFLIYINDLPDFCDESTHESDIYLYADDAKVYRKIQSKKDEASLQSTVNKLKEWSDTWLLKLNIDKCKVVSYSVRDKIDTAWKEGNTVQELERVHSINDLGVIFDTALSFRELCRRRLIRHTV